MRKSRPKKSLGATLLEMIIVLAIASIIMVSLGNLIRAGVDYYFYSTTQLEVQRNGLLSLSILNQELSASTYESVYTDNNLPNPGLVFAVSDNGGGLPARGPSGNLLWTKMTAYYIDIIDDKSCLIRREDPDILRLPPPADPAFPDNPPLPLNIGTDIPHFQGLANPGRLMARNISKIETNELTDALEIVITAEINEGRNWLEMDLETTIVPRN